MILKAKVLRGNVFDLDDLVHRLSAFKKSTMSKQKATRFAVYISYEVGPYNETKTVVTMCAYKGK